MRSEVHIVNLIPISSHIRQLISTLLGLSSKPWESAYYNDLLLRLPLKESLKTLMQNLECDEDEVFQRISARASAFVTNHYTLNLTIDHLRELDSMEVHSHLSPIFNCDPWDVLDELLDVQATLGTLFEVAPEMVRQMLSSRIQDDLPFPHASEAIRNILLAHHEIEERFDIDEYNWNWIVNEHNWLKGNSIDKLRSFCAERGIIQQSGASLLAATLQEYSPHVSTDEIRLDVLALIHIQQRFNWIVRQLHEQAEDLARKVSSSVEDSSPWAGLEQHLMLYELKAPASAWRMMLEPTEVNVTTIKEKLSPIDIRSIVNSGTPKNFSYLKVRTEEIKTNLSVQEFRENEEAARNLIVSCQIEESDLACDILICSNVPPTQLASLEQFFSSIPAITAASSWVSDIGSQLLLTPLISSHSFRDALINACTNFSRAIIQGLILAGVKLPSELDSELDERLSYEFSIKPLTYKQDLVYSINHADLIDMVQKEYTDRSNVRIIK